MQKTLIGMVVSMMLAGSAMATDYQVAISADGLGTLNEYAATAKGISLLGTYGVDAVYNSGLNGCPTTAVGASDSVTSPDASVVFAIYNPCGAHAVIVEFGVTNHGMYERYRTAGTLIGGFGNHNAQYQSMSVGPQNSLTVYEVTPEGPGANEAVLYDNEMRVLAGVYSISSLATHVVTAKIDSSGSFFYVCQDDGKLIMNEFTAESNVLIYSQPVYPVPYKQVFVTADAVQYAAFCQ